MSNEVSQENEHFIQRVIEEGSYSDRAEVLDEAVKLLKERRELLEHIDIGTRQLRNGESTEYDNETLKEFFDDIQARGKKRHRYEAIPNH